jgi:hypothetical protein
VADVKLSILYHLTQGTGIEANNGLYPPLLVSKKKNNASEPEF